MNEENKKTSKIKKISIVVIAVVVIVAISVLVYKMNSKNGNSVAGTTQTGVDGKTKMTPEQEAKAKAEAVALLAELGQYMIVPKGEEPAIFDVQDPAVLAKEQPFFAEAQKGDKLFVFSKSQKAVVYSPSRKIIVNVGPVTFDKNAQEKAAATATPVTTGETEKVTEKKVDTKNKK